MKYLKLRELIDGVVNFIAENVINLPERLEQAGGYVSGSLERCVTATVCFCMSFVYLEQAAMCSP